MATPREYREAVEKVITPDRLAHIMDLVALAAEEPERHCGAVIAAARLMLEHTKGLAVASSVLEDIADIKAEQAAIRAELAKGGAGRLSGN